MVSLCRNWVFPMRTAPRLMRQSAVADTAASVAACRHTVATTRGCNNKAGSLKSGSDVDQPVATWLQSADISTMLNQKTDAATVANVGFETVLGFELFQEFSGVEFGTQNS